MKRLSVLALLLSCLTCQITHADVKFSEIYFSPEDITFGDGGDGRQFIELESTTGGAESLSNLWILEIEGDAANVGLNDNPGEILTAINLGNAPNPNTGSNGLFLWRDSASVLDTSPAAGVQGPDAATSVYVLDNHPGRLDLGWEGNLNEFQNQIVTFLLVENFTGSVGDDLDADGGAIGGDGILETTPWTNVLDALSAQETGDPGFQYAESLDPGGTLGFVDYVGDTFGADHFSVDPVRDEWMFFDSSSGDTDPGYSDPFYADDGLWFFGTESQNDAGFENGDTIYVAPDTEYLYATPGTSNISGVGGLFRGDVNHDGVVDAADIDFLYDNLGSDRTDLNVDLDFGFPSLSDLDDVVALVEGDTGNGSEDLLNTKFGDADLDQDIDGADLLALFRGFGSNSGWAGGDFDGNDTVNDADLLTLMEQYGFSAPTVAAATTAVPEPTTFVLIALGCLFIRKSRNR